MNCLLQIGVMLDGVQQVLKNKNMSTIFGVLKKEYDYINVEYDEDNILVSSQYAAPDLKAIDWENCAEWFEKVAIRFNGDGGEWINPIADLLPDDTKVWALENTPQGVYFIKDLKELINAR